MPVPSVDRMKFTLDVDLSRVAGDPTSELERILRYWGGNMRHYDLTQPVTTEVSDSEYAVVGSWTLSS